MLQLHSHYFSLQLFWLSLRRLFVQRLCVAGTWLGHLSAFLLLLPIATLGPTLGDSPSWHMTMHVVGATGAIILMFVCHLLILIGAGRRSAAFRARCGVVTLMACVLIVYIVLAIKPPSDRHMRQSASALVEWTSVSLISIMLWLYPGLKHVGFSIELDDFAIQ